MKLTDYDGRNLRLHRGNPIFHPMSRSVIGRYAIDDRNQITAVFPRTKSEHYYRKYSGYAVSTDVLSRIYQQGVRTLYILEREFPEDDVSSVIEYDIASFSRGLLVAYSPSENTTVEGELAIAQADSDVFSDQQRVVADEERRKTWDITEVDVA